MTTDAFSFADNWDPDVGLWWAEGPGHTAAVRDLPRVHNGRLASRILLAACVLGREEEVDTGAVLRAFRTMQVTDGARRGCFRWYWEEPAPQDTNASFFIGMHLVALGIRYADRLGDEDRDLLQSILDDLYAWFFHAVKTGGAHYPNRYLGDLACGWLLAEILGRDEDLPVIGEAIETASRYWREHGWGWGEHMSDVYAGVCLQELGLVLGLAEKLPPAIRAALEALETDLLSIEDAFGGGPRVPALRSYAMTAAPTPVPFREKVRPLRAADVGVESAPGPIEAVLHETGWTDRVLPPSPTASRLDIPCFNETVARARIEADIRFGVMSRFPVMDEAEQFTWGLSWQCFPFVFFGPEAGWGFLQWVAEEEGVTRAHPAVDRKNSYHRNALSRAVLPPIVGQTFGQLRGSVALAVRRMPAVAQSWTRLEDRFRILDASASVEGPETKGAASRLTLAWKGRRLHLHHVDLADLGPPEFSRDDGAIHWSVRYDAAALDGRMRATHLWALSLDVLPDVPPAVVEEPDPLLRPRGPGEAIRTVTWPWPDETLRLRIDPLAPIPFADESRDLP